MSPPVPKEVNETIMSVQYDSDEFNEFGDEKPARLFPKNLFTENAYERD